MIQRFTFVISSSSLELAMKKIPQRGKQERNLIERLNWERSPRQEKIIIESMKIVFTKKPSKSSQCKAGKLSYSRNNPI
jgi:hypothetical protein